MNWILTAQIINIIIFFISLYFLMIKRPEMLLPALFAGISLNGFNFLLGTLWYPFKIVNIFIFLFVIFKLLPENIDRKTYNLFSLVFFLALINALFNLPDQKINTGLLQGPLLRPIVQLYTYFSTFSLIVFMPYILKNDKLFLKTDKYYMRFSEFMIFVGLVHFIFIELNMDFMPILRSHGEHSKLAKFSADGIIMNRVYGFAGEPKHLGTYLLPYFFISFYKYLKGIVNRNPLYHKITLLLSLFVIVQTYSSAVLIGLFVGLILGFLLKFYFFKERKIKQAVFFLFLFLSVGTILINRGNNYQNVSFLEFLEARTIGRVETEIDERPESLALENLIDKSAFPLMGFGPGMYVFAIKGLVFDSGISNINSGWVVILSDLGIPGVLLYLFIIIKTVYERHKIAPEYKLYYNAYALGLVSVGTGMLGNNQVILFPLLLAFVMTIKKLSDRKIMNDLINNETEITKN